MAKLDPRTRYFLAVDDDIFLHPAQLQLLCNALMHDPSVPHGIYGQTWSDGVFRGGVAERDQRIDVVSRVYAFTDDHVKEFFRLTEAAGMPVETLARAECVDDVFLSFCGDRRPMIHDVGPFIDCPTQGKKGIATWRRNNFHSNRIALYQKLTAIKPLLPDT